jgi:hypothetical protein
MASRPPITDKAAPCPQNFLVERVSLASDGTEANGSSFNPAISANGRYVTYGTYASNLVPDDTNSGSDVVVASTDHWLL